MKRQQLNPADALVQYKPHYGHDEQKHTIVVPDVISDFSFDQRQLMLSAFAELAVRAHNQNEEPRPHHRRADEMHEYAKKKPNEDSNHFIKRAAHEVIRVVNEDLVEVLERGVRQLEIEAGAPFPHRYYFPKIPEFDAANKNQVAMAMAAAYDSALQPAEVSAAVIDSYGAALLSTANENQLISQRPRTLLNVLKKQSIGLIT